MQKKCNLKELELFLPIINNILVISRNTAKNCSSISLPVLNVCWWNSKSDNVGLRMLILTIVMLTMNEGTTGAYYSVHPAFGFTNEQHELRKKKVFLCHIWKPVRFFFFYRVNPNLKDLKPTFALKTEGLFVFFGRRGEK